MGPFYLLRDNATIASELDLVRDHDLLKRTHTYGINDPDSRAAAEGAAALFLSESEGKGTRDSVRDTTMNMVLRPNEALVWRWGHLVPVKYHGRLDIKVWGPRSGEGKVWGGQAAERICNGRWEYRPDFTREIWRKGAERADGVRTEPGELVPEDGKTGTIVWKIAQPVPVRGRQARRRGDRSEVLRLLGWNEVARGGRRPGRPVSISRTRATPATNTGSSASCRRERGSSAWPSSMTCRWLRWLCPAWCRREPAHLQRPNDRDAQGARRPRLGRAVAIPTARRAAGAAFPGAKRYDGRD